MEQESLAFRWTGFSPILSLLMPTFALPFAPVLLTHSLLCSWNAPLPDFRRHSFGSMFDARLLSMLNRSTSELLRTL